jgi:phasin family protein
MLSANDKFVALNKKQAETGLMIVQIAFETLEKLARLNLAAAKSLFQEGVETALTVAATKDATQVLALGNGAGRGGPEKLLGYSSNVYEITAKAGAEIGNVLEQTLLESGQEFANWADEVLKTSPLRQSEGATSAAKAAMANATSIIEGISRAARQAASYADASVRATAAATAEAVRDAAK